MENRNSYVAYLKRQRDIEYPAEMNKLREKLEQLEKQRKDAALEIEFLENQTTEKTIFDLPNLVLTKILEKFCVLRPHQLLSMCLASPVLEEIITKENGIRKFPLVGESAFQILVQKSYLNLRDLENCVESKSEDLGMFAATSWRFLQPQPVFEHIYIKHGHELKNLEDEILAKQEQNRVWAAFAGRCFSFNCLCLGVNFLTFMETYGKYMLIFKVVDYSFKNFGVQQLRSILEGNLPNVQTFYVCSGDERREGERYDLTTVTDRVTRRKMFVLRANSISKNDQTSLKILFSKMLQTWAYDAKGNTELQNEDLRELGLRLGFGTATVKEIYSKFISTMNWDWKNIKFKNIIHLEPWSILRKNHDYQLLNLG